MYQKTSIEVNGRKCNTNREFYFTEERLREKASAEPKGCSRFDHFSFIQMSNAR